METGVCASHMVLGASLNPRSQPADWAARKNNCVLPRNAACAVVFPVVQGSGLSVSALCRAYPPKGYTDPYWPPAESDEEEEEPVDEAAKWAGLFEEPVYDRDHARAKKTRDRFFNQIFPHKLLAQKQPPERLQMKFRELQQVVKTLGTKDEEGCAENEEPAESSFSAVVHKLRAAEWRRKKRIRETAAAKREIIQARRKERMEREAAAKEQPREFTLSDFAGVTGGDFEDEVDDEDEDEVEDEDEDEDEASDYVEDSGDDSGYSTDDLIGAYSKDEILEDFSSDDLRTDAEYSDEGDWEGDFKDAERENGAIEAPKAPASPPVYFSEASDIAKMNDLSQLTVTQLRNMCKVRKITGYTKKKKEELVAILSGSS